MLGITLASMRDGGINYSGGWASLPKPRMETATILLSVPFPTTKHFRGRILADDNLILDDEFLWKLSTAYSFRPRPTHSPQFSSASYGNRCDRPRC